MTDEARALAIVAALLSGASGSAGFVGGRISAPVPPAEVRYVTLPAPAPVVVEPPAPVAPLELEPPAAPVAAEPGPAPEVESAPVPKPRPKIEAKPKAQPKPKARPSTLKKSLPSCDVVRREKQRMSYAEQLAAYARASAEEVAHGKRCLGM